MNDQYAELYSSYKWFVPSQFNIAQACVHRWAENSHEGRRIALYAEDEAGQADIWSYTRLAETANQLANGLLRMGVQAGDRIAVAMGQRPETAAAYTAIFCVGGVAMPLAATLSVQQLEARLRNAEARVAIVDAASGPDLVQAQMNYPGLSQIVGLGFQHDNIIPWRTLLARQPASFRPMPTRSSSPALLMYPDGADATKGALLAHGALIGSLPGFVASQNWFPNEAESFWSPAGWTTLPGLLASLLPALYFGRPNVAALGRFSVTRMFEIMERYQVSHAFFRPETLLQAADELPAPRERFRLALRGIAMDGESNQAEAAFQWSRQALGVTPNTVFGQPEAWHILGNSHQKWPVQPGTIGRPYPGHLATVLDPMGKPCPAGVVGELAVNRYDVQGHPDPAVFLGYWRNDSATQARFSGDWCLTGALATVDKQGDFRYVGRSEAS